MLFNSYSFLFLFLPATLLGYLLIGKLQSRVLSLGFLVFSSIVFYAAWNPLNLALILPSVGLNYALGTAIRSRVRCGAQKQRTASWLLYAGVLFNLCYLGYFKYKNFFLDTSNLLLGSDFALTSVILPLGISFITFQKIAFLVDVRSENIKDFDIYDFLTFVFFFPQLIAGPIVHYREIMPQFDRIDHRLRAQDLAVGICLFAIGLFKKVVLADGVAMHATPIFNAAEQGQHIDFLMGWIGALAYTFQIYFDFSGYSDMAIGLARLFGIRLPMNFNSPLKSSSIIEFWSRWHITLTRFLTAYIYTPVVMSLTRSRMRQDKPLITRTKASLPAFLSLVAWPTLLTMFLSGFWHGAGFTFLVWGLLHGLYLCVNHAWRQWRPKSWNKERYARVMKPLGFVLTFGAVVMAMVLFRARTLEGAARILQGMIGLEGISLPNAILARFGGLSELLTNFGVQGNLNSGSAFAMACVWLLVLFAITTWSPNSLDLLRDYQPALDYVPPKDTSLVKPPSRTASTFTLASAARTAPLLKIALNRRWAIVMASIFVLGVFSLNRVSEFLYWQF